MSALLDNFTKAWQIPTSDYGYRPLAGSLVPPGLQVINTIYSVLGGLLIYAPNNGYPFNLQMAPGKIYKVYWELYSNYGLWIFPLDGGTTVTDLTLMGN